MEKFYRVIKENFLWEVGAILKANNDGGFVPVDDIFVKVDNTREYISTKIIENSPEYFERVYKVDLVSKVVYKLREEAKEILKKEYK